MELKKPIYQNKRQEALHHIERKVDINILLNRVKNEEKNAIKKNFIITFGVAGSLLITGLITVL